MLRLTKNVVSVACMLDEPERHELEFYDRVRAETLHRLTAMPSYECKNLRWKISGTTSGDGESYAKWRDSYVAYHVYGWKQSVFLSGGY